MLFQLMISIVFLLLDLIKQYSILKNSESETAPVEACFSYSDYRSVVKSPTMELHEVIFEKDEDMKTEEMEETKKYRGPYRYYKQAVKQRF